MPAESREVVVLVGQEAAKRSSSEPQGWTHVAVELANALAWPIVALLLGGALLRSGLIDRISSQIKSIKGAGLEFSFTEEDASRVQSSITESYRAFARVAREAAEREANVHRVNESLELAVRAVRKEMDANTWPDDYRATVHVPDVVVREFLYQLTDYFPNGNGSGRRFSVRRGIIGRCWRLGCSLGSGDALALRDKSAEFQVPAELNSEDAALVAEWGMTTQEVAAWRKDKRHSFLCILLCTSDKAAEPVGILYIDSRNKGAFGSSEVARTAAAALEKRPEVLQLADRVSTVLSELRRKGTSLEFNQSAN